MKDKGLKKRGLEYKYWKKWFTLIDLLYKKRDLKFRKDSNPVLAREELRDTDFFTKIEEEIKNTYREIENIEKEAKNKGIKLRQLNFKKKYHLSMEETLLLIALLKNELEGGMKRTNRGVHLLELITEDETEKLEKLSFFSANGNLIKKKLIVQEFWVSPLKTD